MCGDTNITPSDNDTFNFAFGNMNDAWISSGSNGSKQYTYDTETNTYLQYDTRIIRSRLDRILYKFLPIHNSIPKFNLIKGENINQCEPSDHYGVCVDFFIKITSIF